MHADEPWIRRWAEELPTSALLQFTLSNQPDEWQAATTFHNRFNNYVMAVRVQVNRIWADFDAANAYWESARMKDDEGNIVNIDWGTHDGGFELQSMAFVDLHFYFIAWDNAHDALRVLAREVKSLQGPKQVYSRHEAVLKHYTAARNNLEHFDERQPGKGRQSEALSGPDSFVSGASYWGFGNLEGGTYRFGPRSWDVTLESVAKLEAVAIDLEISIRTEAISMLVTQQRERRQ